MSISYSGLTNYGKTSLSSVENWGTNNNILRDPPKSITTRRIDKVFDNSNIAQDIEGSGDRIAEMIMAYPRATNPMVGISYSNSNMGAGSYQSKQSYLPYRVARDGAFRPPILSPMDLMPLSRLPRNITSIEPILYNPDFTKRLTCAPEKRATRTTLLKTCVNPTVYFKMQTIQPTSTKYLVQDRLKGSYETNTKFPNQPGVQSPTSGEHAYIQNVREGSVYSNAKSQNNKTIAHEYLAQPMNDRIHAEGFTNKVAQGNGLAVVADPSFKRIFGRAGIVVNRDVREGAQHLLQDQQSGFAVRVGQRPVGGHMRDDH
jgi:hypothetical protein